MNASELQNDLADTWLRAEGVRMEYVRATTGDAVLAIESLDLTVPKGQFVSMVGPSGCGKTTFLKILSGLFPPTDGMIWLKGRPLAQTSRDRAMVFQEASLFPWFNVVRNVGYGLECRGLGKRSAQAKAKPYVDLVGLSGFEQHFPHELSGGMQQRANLARALAVDPDVLLMDEPFAALDAQTREQMQAELLKVWEQTKKTVVFITHQIEEAIFLSDRVVVLSARPGRVIDDVQIALPRPRALEVKRTDEFHAYEDRVWRLIQSQPRPEIEEPQEERPAQ